MSGSLSWLKPRLSAARETGKSGRRPAAVNAVATWLHQVAAVCLQQSAELMCEKKHESLEINPRVYDAKPEDFLDATSSALAHSAHTQQNDQVDLVARIGVPGPGAAETGQLSTRFSGCSRITRLGLYAKAC